MQKRTIIERIEIEPQTGNVAVRMRKQVIDDAGNVIASDYHRTTIDSATDPDRQLEHVNAHLAAMGFPAVKAEDVATLNAAISPLSALRAAKAQEARAKHAG